MTGSVYIAQALAARYPEAAFSVDDDGTIHWQGEPPADWSDAELPALVAEAAKADLRRRVAARRYEIETGGTVWNGWPVHTDRASQAKITAACLAAQSGLWPAAGAPWKFADGRFRALTPAQVIDLAEAVLRHVQGAYATEMAKLAEIDATGTTDLDAGWA